MASVAMVTYNHAGYIRQAIESVLSQKTSFPFELVIGEDCSTDGTREIVLEYQRLFPQQVRVITSEQNVGGIENLRRIERQCRGRYIAYCEGDDYWHLSEKLERQVSFLEAHPEYILVHTNFRVFYQDSGRLDPQGIRGSNGSDDIGAYDELISGTRWVHTLTACTRRSVLSEISETCDEIHNPRFLMGDLQRWLELARRGRVKYLPMISATRHNLLESASQSKSPVRMLRFELSIKELVDHYIAKYGCSSAVQSASLRRSTVRVLRYAYEAGEPAIARKMLNEYLGLGIPRDPLVFLYCVGSYSAWRRRMTRPCIEAVLFTKKIRRKIIDFWRAHEPGRFPELNASA
jgi:glycosyltransferase involved in cell wall biosynthesis